MIATEPAAMHQAVIAAFPDLAGRDVVVHDGGWDSVALEIGGTWLCNSHAMPTVSMHSGARLRCWRCCAPG